MPKLHRVAPWLFLVLTACQDDPGAPGPSASGQPGSQKATAPSASAAGSAAKEPPPIDGAALYAKYCALCHGKEGKGYAADNAPSLVSQTFLESATDHYIARGIRVGRPGTAMAGYAKRIGGPLDEKEIQAIVRFLREKGPKAMRLPHVVPSGDAEKGARLFEQQCETCHGETQKPRKGPWLLNSEFLTAATPAFLRHAIVHGRPPTEMPAYGGRLKDAEIDDLVMFLTSKKPNYRPPRPEVDLEAIAKLPVVTNPKGSKPQFTLREGRFVSIDQVKKALDAKQRMVIVDARAASDFVRLHIPGAFPNPYYDRQGLNRIPNDGTWVIAYCACPHHASGEVVDELRRRGHANTAVLDEGILEWHRRGYPVAGQDADEAKPAPKAPGTSSQRF